MKASPAAALLAAALVAGPALADCPMDLGRGTGIVVYSSLYMLAFRPDPQPIEVGQPFTLLVNVCTKKDEPAELVGVDATMPAHRHGMNYKPTVQAAGNGRYRVEGLLFHMPGTWEIAFDVRSGGDVQQLSHGIVLK